MSSDPEFPNPYVTPQDFLNARYHMKLIQEPTEAKILPNHQTSKGHTWPADPPPVLELEKVFLRDDSADAECRLFRHSPLWFCTAETISMNVDEGKKTARGAAAANSRLAPGRSGHTWTSSLHKLKSGPKGEEHLGERGYFVFGDVNFRETGCYKLRFTLYQMRHDGDKVYTQRIESCETQEFRVHSHRVMQRHDVTPLTKHLSENGVRVKLRNDGTAKRARPRLDWSNKVHEAVQARPSLAPDVGNNMLAAQTVPIRARYDVGDDISSRVETNHAPLSSMVVSHMPSQQYHHMNFQPSGPSMMSPGYLAGAHGQGNHLSGQFLMSSAMQHNGGQQYPNWSAGMTSPPEMLQHHYGHSSHNAATNTFMPSAYTPISHRYTDERQFSQPAMPNMYPARTDSGSSSIAPHAMMYPGMNMALPPLQQVPMMGPSLSAQTWAQQPSPQRLRLPQFPPHAHSAMAQAYDTQLDYPAQPGPEHE